MKGLKFVILIFIIRACTMYAPLPFKDDSDLYNFLLYSQPYFAIITYIISVFALSILNIQIGKKERPFIYIWLVNEVYHCIKIPVYLYKYYFNQTYLKISEYFQLDAWVTFGILIALCLVIFLKQKINDKVHR